ncbi:MAG: Spy/CpxP family protein refolding chaperone [Gemmatimonadota bacterium]
MPRFARSLILALALAATPAAAQEPPDVHRLEELRFQRMQEALSLSQEQMESLRSTIEALRAKSLGLRETERESMEGLREALRRQPTDEAAIARALKSLDGGRKELERLRIEHLDLLAEILGPEQRARLLLFNHHFDNRLRELIDRRRGPGAGPGRPAPPGHDGRQGWNPRDGTPRGPQGEGWLERRLQGLPPAERRQAIERLRGELDRLERGLETED